MSTQGLRVLNSHEPIRDVLAQSGCRVLWLCLRLCLFTVYLAGADAVAPVRGALGMLKLRAESSLDILGDGQTLRALFDYADREHNRFVYQAPDRCGGR